MRPDMKLMPARVFISGAGLSYCCVYMMLGRYETFISGRHGKSCRHGKPHVNKIFSYLGDMKTKSI